MAFMYKMAAALIEPISDSRLVNSIGAAGDSLILILSCLICVSVMFFYNDSHNGFCRKGLYGHII